MKISTKNTDVLCLSSNPRQPMLLVSSNTLKQVFTSDRRCSEEIDTWISKDKAVLHELYRFVITKQEVSNTTKLSVFKSVFVPILTYCHESWVMTERILPQVQAPEMGFCKESMV